MFSTRLGFPTVAGALALALGPAACGSAQGGTDSSSGPIMQYATYGAVLVVALVFLPRGLVPSATGAAAAVRQRARAGAGS